MIGFILKILPGSSFPIHLHLVPATLSATMLLCGWHHTRIRWSSVVNYWRLPFQASSILPGSEDTRRSCISTKNQRSAGKSGNTRPCIPTRFHIRSPALPTIASIPSMTYQANLSTRDLHSRWFAKPGGITVPGKSPPALSHPLWVHRLLELGERLCRYCLFCHCLCHCLLLFCVCFSLLHISQAIFYIRIHIHHVLAHKII